MSTYNAFLTRTTITLTLSNLTLTKTMNATKRTIRQQLQQRYLTSKVRPRSYILRPYNIRVAHKPITTLRHVLTNVKNREQPDERQGAVYKINCSDCQATYVGETGRNLNIRLTEHKRATKKQDKTNHIAEHHQQTKHNIDCMD